MSLAQLTNQPNSDSDLPSPPTSPPKRPSSSRSWVPSRRRPSPDPRTTPFTPRSSTLVDSAAKRDSGFAPSVVRPADDCDVSQRARIPSLPTIVVQDDESRRSSAASNVHASRSHSRCQSIETDIPKGDFDELADNRIQFSKRGTLLLNGKRMKDQNSTAKETRDPKEGPRDGTRHLGQGDDHHQQTKKELPSPTIPEPDTASQPPSSVPISSAASYTRPRNLAATREVSGARALSADETMLSKKVRSMYEYGDEKAADWVMEQPAGANEDSIVEVGRVPAPRDGDTLSIAKSRNGDAPRTFSIVSSVRPKSAISKEPHELAGGIEDWEDIEGSEVDRYGFIVPKKITSPDQRDSLVTFEAPKLQRVSTQLQLATDSPRRKRTLRRTPSFARSSRTTFSKRFSSNRSLRPPESIMTVKTTATIRSNPFRLAANRLPHNRERKLVDEASDMLTLPPGLASIAEQDESGRTAARMKRKEWQREEKWRKMGRMVGRSTTGGGMMFEFDTKHPKLIERTWKGIPDRWRATAWHAFLSASAKNTPGQVTDEELVESFYELQEEDCADDMQIDVDVPRTISHHIMFRRRYRGGQRLMFRVLHAMAIYFPETGYVQGMAALAATLLCYYDEERCFVMMVRMWTLRGLGRLYEAGFEGLMEALNDFERDWLRNGDVAQKLEEHGIHTTAYGTRWYLTLFNYSLPFPAQLRVWDVFMLLGDVSNANDLGNSFHADMDVLHATSAALIDATRDIIVDSDFENAMKTLTSWVPVKDEDLLMRVAKAEWKARKKRAARGANEHKLGFGLATLTRPSTARPATARPSSAIPANRPMTARPSSARDQSAVPPVPLSASVAG
ncbi:rab-GTPase-TBC domain-containing protein [Phyllosticta citribraziliensis]|uniref:Rab-GTPase-TBC domain-containing protein n=1 Tax=Phyllosticta citribraziliensis TaxID=989973 RepID=A0ABR1LCV2_9PEZI